MSGSRNIGDRLERGLAHPAGGAVLLLVIAALYCWAYWHHPLNPGAAPPSERLGWWSWSDQYKYLQEARELAAGGLSREAYQYPLGYPALGAVFVRWLPAHPFFVPDLLLVLGAAGLWWRLVRRWLPATAALVVAAGFIATHTELLPLTMVVPWNTLPTQCALLAGLVVALETRGPRTVWWLAGLTAVTWWMRPVDAAAFSPLLVWAVLRLPAWRERVACAAGGIAIIAGAMAAVGLVNLQVWGTWRSAYEVASFNGVGFFGYPLGQKLFWTFVDARPFFGEADTALLWRYPWLLLAVPGACYWVKREGAAGAVILASVALSWLSYLGYNDFFPSSFYRFSLIHYVSWTFLPLLAGAAGACWAGWRMRAVWAGWGGAVLLLGLAGGLQLEEQALPAAVAPGEVRALPARRPLWVSFPGESPDKVAWLRLDGRPLHEGSDYQIPYVPGDLQLLLGARAAGARLTATPEAGLGATPRVGDYRWAWRWDWRRGARRD